METFGKALFFRRFQTNSATELAHWIETGSFQGTRTIGTVSMVLTVWSQWSGPIGTNGHTVLHIQYHSIQTHVGYYLSDVNISSGEPGDGREFFVPARVP